MATEKTLNHIAIIMDGNGRWAKSRGVDRAEGHRAGALALKEIIRSMDELGFNYLTVYAFSTENWKRSPKEVNALMSLLSEFIDNDLAELHEKNVRVNAIGQLERIPWHVRRKLLAALEKTKQNTGKTVTFALSYGGRAEIVDATKKIAEKVAAGELKPSKIDEELFADNLYEPSLPDPELMVRTSGELRLSNFLLWQLSYAEFYVTDTLWPDFTPQELAKAIDHFYGRDRRFGGRDEA